MSLPEPYTSRPPVVTGPDGLPHCARCTSDTLLCAWHRAQLRSILDGLKTPNLLGRAQADLRYVIKRPSLDEGDA